MDLPKDGERGSARVFSPISLFTPAQKTAFVTRILNSVSKIPFGTTVLVSFSPYKAFVEDGVTG